MGKTIVAVRNVDEDVFLKFKALRVEERMRLGEALTKAMKVWMEEKRERKIHNLRIPKLKPFGWGKGTERTSKEVDEILYGGK